MEIPMGTYRIIDNHLHGVNCQWCKAKTTKKYNAYLKSEAAYFDRKEQVAGFAIISMFILAVCVNIF